MPPVCKQEEPLLNCYSLYLQCYYYTWKDRVSRPDLSNEFGSIIVLHKDIHLMTNLVSFVGRVCAESWIDHGDKLLLVGMQPFA